MSGESETKTVKVQIDRDLVKRVHRFVRQNPRLGYLSHQDFTRDALRRFLFETSQ